jgi:hypothetical protein
VYSEPEQEPELNRWVSGFNKVMQLLLYNVYSGHKGFEDFKALFYGLTLSQTSYCCKKIAINNENFRHKKQAPSAIAISNEILGRFGDSKPLSSAHCTRLSNLNTVVRSIALSNFIKTFETIFVS